MDKKRHSAHEIGLTELVVLYANIIKQGIHKYLL